MEAAVEALVHLEQWDDVRKFLEVTNPVKHPPVTVLRVHAKAIAAAGRAKQVDVAMGMFNRMKERGFMVNTVCYNSAIDACRRSGRIAHAEALFADMQARRRGAPRPDLVTYSSMIGMYAHVGRVDEALDLLVEMDEMRGLRPNARTYALAVIACESANQPKKAKQLLEAADRVCNMQDQRLQLWQIVVGNYTKTGRLSEALEGLKTMLEKGVVTDTYYYTESIKLCRSGGLYPQAVELCKEAMSLGVMMDHRGYRAALEACARGMLVDDALAILSEMQTKAQSDPTVHPDRKHFTSVMVACGRARRWVEAQKLMEGMEQAGLTPDVVCFNVLLDVFTKCDMWERGLETLESMAKRGIQPDIVSYNTVMAGCSRAGQWMACLELMDSMRGRGVNPDRVSYIHALTACWIARAEDEAMALVADMERGGTEDVLMTNTVYLDAMRRAFGKGSPQVSLVQLLENMKEAGFTPDVRTYGAVLHGLGQSEQWEVCLKVSEPEL